MRAFFLEDARQVFETFLIRFSLLFWFVAFSLRQWTPPWRFFQVNAEYFNEKKRIFSKLDTDQYIPEQWRLHQDYADVEAIPAHFPVFIKPEWGQNARGIYRADTPEQFRSVWDRIKGQRIPHIIQEAAIEGREFEIFYIRSSQDCRNFSFLSITEVLNSRGEPLPINGIHNKDTIYLDRTDDFSEPDLHTLWRHVGAIGTFRIARVCTRADSKKDLLAGSFHIVEINLFLPMPLSLLDRHLSWRRKQRFIRKTMRLATKAVKAIPRRQKRKPVFRKQLVAHYRITA